MTSRRLNLSVQYACNPTGLPSRSEIRRWVRAALDVDGMRGGRITVRFVETEEGLALNSTYRGKTYATNVLSFPYESDPVVCGDLVICPDVVVREASEQGKTTADHFAHLIVHGLLHLQGYDHETGRSDARNMEAKEKAILAGLGHPDPYKNS